MRTIAPLLLAALIFAAPAAGQTLRGRVVDAGSGAPVAEAGVTALGSRGNEAMRARTGTAGEFTLVSRTPGVFRVRVERTGYASATSREVTVGPGETVEVEIRVSAQPLTLEPLTVKGRQGPQRTPEMETTGFYEREARGFGRFYRREFIEARKQRPMANILDEVPGIRLFRDRAGTEYVIFDRAQTTGSLRRASKGEEDKCLPLFFLDGNRVAVGGRMQSVNDLVDATQVEAVEVYGSAAQLPVEFNSVDAGCGVIVIWTRRGR